MVTHFVDHVARMTSSLTPASVLSEVSRTYDRRVMNNVRRSEYVEAIVALALEDSGWTRMTVSGLPILHTWRFDLAGGRVGM